MQFQLALEQGLEEFKQIVLHEHHSALNRSLRSESCIERPELAIKPRALRGKHFSKEVERPCVSPTPSEEFEIRELVPEKAHEGKELLECKTWSSVQLDQSFSQPLVGEEFAGVVSEYVSSCPGERALDNWSNICLIMLAPRGRYKMMSASTPGITLSLFWAAIAANSTMTESELIRWLRRVSDPRFQASSSRLNDTLATLFNPTFFSFRVAHPNSWQCLFWYSMSVVFLVYDLIMVPLALGFDLQDFNFQNNLGWWARIFWTVDVLVNFFVGRYIGNFLEMSFNHSARRYLQTWFGLDVLLVSIDWASLGMTGDAKGTSYGGMVRVLRISRLLRVLRLERMFSLFIDILGSSRTCAHQVVRVIQLILFIALWTHFMACFWHGMKYMHNDSWADDLYGSVTRKYFIAAHWSLSQVHGTNHSIPSNTSEWGLATLTLLIGLILLSHFVGAMSHLVVFFTEPSPRKLARACGRFMEKRNIPPSVVRRARGFVMQRHRQVGLSEQLTEERELLSLFPEGLRAHILEATRGTFLRRIPFFDILVSLDKRSCRSLCKDGFVEEMHVQDHILFTSGDVCNHMYFVDHGAVAYKHSLNDDLPLEPVTDFQKNIFTHAAEWGVSRIEGMKRRFGSQVLMVGGNICEGALWSPWMNVGSLHTICDSILLALNVIEFEHMVATSFRQNSCLLIAMYAREFVLQLKEEQIPSDLFSIEYSREIAMTILPVEHSNPYQHQMFLSHYKDEAGTEATLLHEGFTRILGERQDKGDVFLDSEALTNLSTLKLHVTGSANLILLLTPGFLTRPWRLAEIVYAWRCEIPIVPVEIQRPGWNFSYPQEEFFEKMLKGDQLERKAYELLEKESIPPTDLVDALRETFTQIALPFSPHKAQAIRDAEMRSIVERCVGISGSTNLSMAFQHGQRTSVIVSDIVADPVAQRRKSVHRQAHPDVLGGLP